MPDGAGGVTLDSAGAVAGSPAGAGFDAALELAEDDPLFAPPQPAMASASSMANTARAAVAHTGANEGRAPRASRMAGR